jgi:YD repeat-containing protein
VTVVTKVIRATGLQPAQQRVTETAYDELGRVDTVEVGTPGSLTLISDHEYDKSGRLETTEDADGNITAYEYYAQGTLKKETLPDPDGTGGLSPPVTLHEYDADGNRIKTTDPRAKVWRTEHDALGREGRVGC